MRNQYQGKLAQNYHAETSAGLLADDKKSLKRELLELAGIANPNGWDILDIGCAGGVHAKFLADTFPHIKSIKGVDSSEELIQIAQKENADPRIEYIVTSMDKMPFADGSFDFVFSRNTIHYSEDLVATMTEINRVMRPGAKFYFQVAHPIYDLFMKPSKDYGLREDASFLIQGGQTQVIHPTFMFSDYVSAIIANNLIILSYREHFGRRSIVGEFRIPVVQIWTLEK